MDELVKMLRTCSERDSCIGWREACPYLGTGVCDNKAEKAADAIEELIAKLNHADDQIDRIAEAAEERRWVSVTERLPEDLTRVIVFCEDGVSYGLCEHLIADDEEVVEWHDFLHYPITPTHWMPLPESPKEV